jgi:hypothetical protein
MFYEDRHGALWAHEISACESRQSIGGVIYGLIKTNKRYLIRGA